MHVLKFGGTSMDDEHNWRQVLDIIARYEHSFIIVSATAKTTRQLLAAAEKAPHSYESARKIADEIRRRHLRLTANFINRFPDAEPVAMQECKLWIDKKIAELENYLSGISKKRELDERLRDAVASIGEQLSSWLFAKCGAVYGLPTQWVDAADTIRTSSDFGQAAPDTDFIRRQTKLLEGHMQSGTVMIMGGYYGRDKNGNITTLGFEGSDYTASLMGAAFSAETIEIWTDVSGIYTCDPRVVPDAQSISELSFQEATELAYFGAKVLHPSTTKPAAQQQIPIMVKNIFDPDHPGTKIHAQAGGGGPAKALTFIEDVVILTITSTEVLMGYRFPAEVLARLEELHIAVDVIITTEASVSVALRAPDLHTGSHFQDLGMVSLTEQQGLISLIGCSFGDTRAITQNVLSAIPDSRISMISYNRAKNNINLVLPQSQLVSSVKAIHAALFTTGE